jgi:hypothetical protein
MAVVTLTATPVYGDDGPEREYVRVTFYTLNGTMSNGDLTHKNAAACSGWLPLGTQLQFEDGFVVTCDDRGKGDCSWKGWVDVWAPSWDWGTRNISNPDTGGYGDYAWVTVLRWGDGPTASVRC